MKWINHNIFSASVAAMTGLPPAGIAVVTAFSVVPDLVEFRIFKHRGWSHGWWVYAFLAFALSAVMPSLSAYIFYAAFGAMLHLICDALTMMGIPVAPFSDKKIAMKLFKTGDLLEYLLCLLFAAGAIFLVAFAR